MTRRQDIGRLRARVKANRLRRVLQLWQTHALCKRHALRTISGHVWRRWKPSAFVIL